MLVVTSAGTLLSSGYAGTGFFSIPDSEVTADINSRNFSALAAAFTSIVSDNFVQGGTALAGTAVPGFYATGNTSFDPTPYIGKTIYTFITNGTSLSAANATQFALLSFSGKLPVAADPATPPPTSYNVYAGDGTIAFGKTGPVTHSDVAGGDFSTIQLQTVPEPSVALLGLLGVAGLVRRRR